MHSAVIMQVYFSRDFANSLVRLPDGHLRARVLRQLHSLARGSWPVRLWPHNAVDPKYQDILQVFQVEDLWLVWMVDADQSTHTQVSTLLPDNSVLARTRPTDDLKGLTA